MRYDNAPTHPAHGGKLTPDMMAARIAELEDAARELRAREKSLTLALRNIRCRTGYSDSRSQSLPAKDVAEVYRIADEALKNMEHQ